MIELIVLIIFLLSLGGIIFIMYKKLPILLQMPETQEGFQKEKFSKKFQERIKGFISFDKLIVLRFLSKVRVYVLKIEKYIDSYLQRTRRNIIKKQQEDKDAIKKINIK